MIGEANRLFRGDAPLTHSSVGLELRFRTFGLPLLLHHHWLLLSEMVHDIKVLVRQEVLSLGYLLALVVVLHLYIICIDDLGTSLGVVVTWVLGIPSCLLLAFQNLDVLRYH